MSLQKYNLLECDKEERYTVPEELRLGCYRSNVGDTGRFAKGLLNDRKTYNYAISDGMMTEMLTSETI